MRLVNDLNGRCTKISLVRIKVDQSLSYQAEHDEYCCCYVRGGSFLRGMLGRGDFGVRKNSVKNWWGAKNYSFVGV